RWRRDSAGLGSRTTTSSTPPSGSSTTPSSPTASESSRSTNRRVHSGEVGRGSQSVGPKRRCNDDSGYSRGVGRVGCVARHGFYHRRSRIRGRRGGRERSRAAPAGCCGQGITRAGPRRSAGLGQAPVGKVRDRGWQVAGSRLRDDVLKACRKEIETFPEEIRGDLADALARLDAGLTLSIPLSRPMPIGQGVHELRLKARSGAYRVVYAL